MNKDMENIVLIGPVYPYKGGISHYTGLMYRALSDKYKVTMVSYKFQYPKLLYNCLLYTSYFNFHMLRHIFATNCISRGFDMKTLSELLGHSNITTTMRIYVHSDMERKKQLMAGYRLAS